MSKMAEKNNNCLISGRILTARAIPFYLWELKHDMQTVSNKIKYTIGLLMLPFFLTVGKVSMQK